MFVAAGVVAVLRTPIDALPDLSDVQGHRSHRSAPGQAPQVVEDHVSADHGHAVGAQVRRWCAGFRSSALRSSTSSRGRHRHLLGAQLARAEYLNFAAGACPRTSPQIGPDATGVGWPYQYALLAKDKTLGPNCSLQDWSSVRYQLTKAHGVAEVASIGGFVQKYNVTVDPVKLRAFGIPLDEGRPGEIRDSWNRDVGGRVVEMAETEYMVRGKGYLRGGRHRATRGGQSRRGTPVLIRDMPGGTGPGRARGVTELEWRRRSRAASCT